MSEAIKKALKNKSLSRAEAESAMNAIMDGEVPADQIGDFLLALRSRGETVDEILGFCLSLRGHGRILPVKRTDLIDTCGTGGDGGSTFNVSTAVAFVVASGGLGVAKHGNRSVSSLCGSGDVYEALGFKIESDPQKCADSLDQYGFSFLYAPYFHPAMSRVAPIRKSLGVRTVFNLLGPLINPAHVKKQVLGIYDRKLLPKIAEVLKELGVEEALVVSSYDGLDEISISDKTEAYHLKGIKISQLEISPEDVGLKKSPIETLRGGDAAENAQIIENILAGKKGPPRDIVSLNAGAALWVGGKAATLKEGFILAEKLIESGQAKAFLKKLKERDQE